MTFSNKCCPKCRIVSKRLYLCSKCGEPMENVGHNWRLPKKGDDKGWAEVQKIIDYKRKVGYGPLDSPTHHSGDKAKLIRETEGEKLLKKIKIP